MSKHEILYRIYGDALDPAQADAETFAAEWSTSVVFGGLCSPEVCTELANLWKVARMSFKELRSTTGMTQAEYSARFYIPPTTYVQWEQDRRQPPVYVKLMMAELLGLVTPAAIMAEIQPDEISIK